MDPEVKTDLNRKVEAHTTLPDLVVNGYYFLGKDWLETSKKWQEAGFKTPPVMITVANRTETAARVQHAFAHGKIRIEELCVPDKILHIDSKALEEAEAQEEPIEIEFTETEGEESEDNSSNGPRRKLSKKDRAELLRKTVDTIGREGQPGEQIQKVISVAMLSEGWDAKTVTHIMGLRAFTSQLLCEQVVGRGLRRTSYEVDEKTGLFRPEYVNIFGVPFTFLPHEGGADAPPPPPPAPKTRIEPVPERSAAHEITWPNVVRIDHEYRPQLTLDPLKTKPLVLDAYDTATLAELAPMIDGKPDVSRLTEISLEELGRKFRMQKIVFATASDLYDQMKPTWKGNREYLLAQLIRLVERFIESGNVQVHPPLFNQDDLRRRIVITLNMNKVVQHMWEAIRFENALSLVPIFDTEKPIYSTGEMLPWYTGKPCEHTKHSHINMCVFDSTWEASEAFELDRKKLVRGQCRLTIAGLWGLVAQRS